MRRVSKRANTASSKTPGSKATSQKKSVSAAEVTKSLGHVRVVAPRASDSARPAAAGRPAPTRGKESVKKPASTDREALREDSEPESEDDEEESYSGSSESGDSAGDEDVIDDDFIARNPLWR